MRTEPGLTYADLASERERRKGRKPGKIPICSDGNNRKKAHTQNGMCLSNDLCVWIIYLVAKTLLPFNASSISFDLVHPVKEQSKLSRLYALSLMEMQIRILSSFFLFIMVFFCAFGLLFEMNVVPLCRLEQVCYSHTTACSVFMLGAKCSQFFLCVWIYA